MYFVIGMLLGSFTGWLLNWLDSRGKAQDLIKRLAELEQHKQEGEILRGQLLQQIAKNAQEILVIKQKLANKEQEILTLNQLVEEYSIRLDRAETTNQDWMGKWDIAQAELEELRLVIAKADNN